MAAVVARLLPARGADGTVVARGALWLLLRGVDNERCASLLRSRWRCSGTAMDGGCASSFSLLRCGVALSLLLLQNCHGAAVVFVNGGRRGG